MTRNEKRFYLDGSDWELAYVKNEEYKAKKPDFSTPDAIRASGLPIIGAEVPGNYEIDLERAGVIEDPFFGTNQWKMRPWESYHFVWFRTFMLDFEPDEYTRLCFEGVDTFADIYVNGEKIGETDNMLIPYAFACAPLKKGENTIAVHIRPTVIEARKFELPVSTHALHYGYDSLYVRKAPHTYGWDIMPRFVSGGIWRPVYVEERKADRIDDIFGAVAGMNLDKKTASIKFFYNISVAGDDIQDYSLRVEGKCGDSSFQSEAMLWHTGGVIWANINDCKFWWPRNYGEPNLYDTHVTLLRNGEPVATLDYKLGVRTVELERTALAGKNDADRSGEFCFKVNGKKIFLLGTNWVPVDALHSRDAKRLPDILPMLNDLGCNGVRCWGGNVYENDMFYDFCDENGILIWQDFIMGCAINPQEKRFADMLEAEATIIVKRLRNHPSLALWAGDNECDICIQGWTGWNRDPNKNILTRRVLPEVLWAHDFTRPYIPSSPYIDEETYKTHGNPSEDHLWGPRDYFKSDFYTKSTCSFVSETGYHACPDPEYVRRFISEEQLFPWHDENGRPKPEWLAHATEMYAKGGSYSYRIALMASQIKVLFGESVPDNFEDFAAASQYSQAEAMKYFIERFRQTKWRRTGIIWWNLIDGWPQFSDAVVGYYGDKKKAYDFIKRSQLPLCLMFDEPKNGAITLNAVSDKQENETVSYRVTDLTAGCVVLEGIGRAIANESTALAAHPIVDGEQHFYLIEWTGEDGIRHTNHFITNIKEINYAEYLKNLANVK